MIRKIMRLQNRRLKKNELKKIVKTQVLVFCTLCFSSLFIQAQNISTSDRFVLSGKVLGVVTGRVYISYQNNLGKQTKDTSELENGKFSFTGSINKMAEATISVGAREVTGFLESGKMTALISGDKKKLPIITGSKTQQENEELETQLIPINTSRNAAGMKISEIDQLIEQGDTTKRLIAQKDSLITKLNNLNKLLEASQGIYVQKNPNSFLSPFLLNYLFARGTLTLDSVDHLYAHFSSIVKSSYYGIDLEKNISGKKASQIGKPAPDFEKIDINGKPFKLSSHINKNYILLDFWASWCVPCREETPILKDLYKRYKNDSLKIVAISWDFNKKDWKKGVEEDDIGNWYNISGFFDPPADGFRSLYAVQHIPMVLLLDKGGVILGRYDGAEAIKDLEIKLLEIFGK